MKDEIKKSDNRDDAWYKNHMRRAELENNTQAKKKLRNYVLSIFKSDYFQNKISEIRKKCDIPPNGYSNESNIVPPEQSTHKSQVIDEIRKEIDIICKKYSLHYLDWFSDIEDYIFYNEFFDVNELNSKSLIYLADLAEEKTDPFEESTQEQDNKHFPIAIRISPYATERDILDFIKRTYKDSILPAQKSYREDGVKIGRIKSKNRKIETRNNFIYENRHLPRKKIMDLVYRKFGGDIDIDYGYIGKIISLEKKKRKDV